MASMNTHAELSVTGGAPQSVHIPASDGYVLSGLLWRPPSGSCPPPLVVINPATSVAARYYGRFARFLQARGMAVLTYDYRGIGQSRPERLRGFEAGWLIWGERDFEAVLQWAGREFPESPVDVVGHSAGGFVLGLAESACRVRRVCTVAAQLGYWADFAPLQRAGMFMKWQLAMPALTALMGYFPGQRLGWLEDSPRGVVHDWTRHMRRLEQTHDRGGPGRHVAERQALVRRCSRMRSPILAIGIDDDAFGTPRALERLMDYFPESPRTHIRVSPHDIGAGPIGHFAFFHDRFEHSLWQLALGWLQSGELTAGMARAAPFRVAPPRNPQTQESFHASEQSFSR